MANTGDPILALNSGSSSLKFALFGAGEGNEQLILQGSAQGIGRKNGTLHLVRANGEVLLDQQHVLESQQEALAKVADALQKHAAIAPVAVGHRIVHGGPDLREHQRLTPEVIAVLKQAVHFAPLHIPEELELVRQAQQTFSEVPHFACFDTVFHRTMPEVASRLPLPGRYQDRGVIRYGFHGLSYESVVYRLGKDLPARAVFCHLGNGSSITAVRDGESIDTSMGLTPAGGVPMGTRTGDIDPGVLIYLLRTEAMDAADLEALVNRSSGLAGFSGGESDVQTLLRRESGGDEAAKLALDAFCIAVKKFVAGYAALLGGLDLLVFTGGIGENSAEIRRRICAGLDFVGVNVDAPDGKVLVMAAQEEMQIARHCRVLLGS